MQITGLTKKQVSMLQIIWNCKDQEQFSAWFNSLEYNDMQTVETLLEILRIELLEKFIVTDSLDEVRELLKKF
jgi:hypothetical protein